MIDALRGGLPSEQASGILQRRLDAARIGHETVYTALHAVPRGELRRQILELLARGHKSRRPRRAGTDRRGPMPGVTSIEQRPAQRWLSNTGP